MGRVCVSLPYGSAGLFAFLLPFLACFASSFVPRLGTSEARRASVCPHCAAGRFSMQVTYNGIPVAGSPFLLYVGPFVAIAARPDQRVAASFTGSAIGTIRALLPVKSTCYAVAVCRAEDVDIAMLVVHLLLHSQAPADIVLLVTKHVRPIVTLRAADSACGCAHPVTLDYCAALGPTGPHGISQVTPADRTMLLEVGRSSSWHAAVVEVAPN